MKIFGIQLGNQKSIAPEVFTPAILNVTPLSNAPSSDMVQSITMAIQTDLPYIHSDRTNEWVNYGSDNLYPEYLKDLFNTSPTHNAIVKTKAEMVVGEQWTYDTTLLSEAENIKILSLVSQIERDKLPLSLDYQIFGAMALEVIWALDFSRIVEINRIDVSRLRSGKYEHGYVTEWYYKRDWSDRREEAVCIYPLDRGDREHHRQLLYVPGQKVSNDYYGEPSYTGAIDWITLESQVGLYYRSLLENGFNPSLLIKFYRKPNSQEERDTIINGLKRSFGGVKNSGKVMTLFSDGKELAPDITPIEVQNVDKQFTVIADQITQKILTGERATTPELFGLSIPGQLGSGDFETKVKCFNRFVIRPDVLKFEKTINDLLRLNGFDINLVITPFTI
jgi:hypothetical protein